MCLVRLVLTTYFHGNKIYVASVKGHMEALMQSLHASENMHEFLCSPHLKFTFPNIAYKGAISVLVHQSFHITQNT